MKIFFHLRKWSNYGRSAQRGSVPNKEPSLNYEARFLSGKPDNWLVFESGVNTDIVVLRPVVNKRYLIDLKRLFHLRFVF